MKSGSYVRPLLPVRVFRARVLASAAVAVGMIGGSLAIGVVGYHVFAGLSWIDSLLNAAMILTGMGPVDPMRTQGAKLFASGYAIFSGVAFLGSVGVVLAPLLHRFLHRYHLDLDDPHAK